VVIFHVHDLDIRAFDFRLTAGPLISYVEELDCFTSSGLAMRWTCASCGWVVKTNRRKCRKCGSMSWNPSRTKEPNEVSGPMKRIAPKGLLLAHPGKQGPAPDSNVECGKCHTIIYRPDRKFDATALQAAMKAHYSTSPKCAGSNS